MLYDPPFAAFGAEPDAFEGVLEALAVIRQLDGRSDPDVWVPLLKALADGGYYAEYLLKLR